ncbi:Eco57I restriction-modification methylase domain-containing protein [Pelotalea chapellei]|uniref:site-specific DNA-methyltransferase (adenine-specific) n=1 Tax=Pelotalea chapellei TaxID=44671 RepID=A0ABS5U4X5_9BACT|nr:N-6 DNA methylase [Pelotalea chapellei]MBT1070705.1 N-6 DNA methylase [Pelotalea chapellei]
MARKNHDSFIYGSMHLEGALFVPDLLEKVALGEQSFQADADYQIPKGLKQHDEYGRAFQIAQAQWKSFSAQRERQDVDAVTITRSFVQEMFRDAFGYSDLQPSAIIEINGRRYPVPFMAAGRVPVFVAPHNLGLDDTDTRFAVEGSGSRKKSVFQLAQEFLNASAECTWALVSNGLQLRLLRDAATLTRPSYLEFDLESILSDVRYPDFAALWRIVHFSRAGQAGTSGNSCIWEQWRQEGQAQGTRVREGLRRGVTSALMALGEGFLRHNENEPLRQSLQDGSFTKDEFYQQLLRLVYRLIFLFTVEERELLHLSDETPQRVKARKAYADGYSLRRLRTRALRRAGFDLHDDLWQAQLIVFRCLVKGESRLALPPLGGLFAPAQCGTLDTCGLDNQAFLTAIRHLRWSQIDRAMAPVDYRNMGPEELGSVYESLLELVPDVDLHARKFTFINLSDEASTAGNARKTSGSYYTPDSLVQELIKSALEPVIEQRLAAQPENPTRALLTTTIIDPACGSGHFLLAAARRLAERLAQYQAVDGAVKTSDYRHALREVIAHCIFGVDRNPLALELARTALWLEGFEPGRPLSFLDHHLVCGDALLGVTDLKQMAAGIPDGAYKPLSGDDKTVCKALMQLNKAGRKSIRTRKHGPELFSPQEWQDSLAQLDKLEAMPDETPEEVAAKEAAYELFLKQAGDNNLAHSADLFMGAFLIVKSDKVSPETVPTSETLGIELYGGHSDSSHDVRLKTARTHCRQARVLHWPLVFPQVFARGGFDCVLGNPPWERIKLQEEEFFATRHPDVATAKNKSERGQRIQWLSEGMLAKHLYPELLHNEQQGLLEQRLYDEFITGRRTAEAASLYAHLDGNDGGRYPLTGVGDVNTYALFAETISQIVSKDGRAGFIVPTGIATDDSTKAYFADIALHSKLVSLYDFENREEIFKGVHRSYKFCLITLGVTSSSDFAFYLSQTSQLTDQNRRFSLGRDDFRLINPNTSTCPIFRSKKDAELTKKIYTKIPVLIRDATDKNPEINPFSIRFNTMFHMSNDSHLFADYDGGEHLPLYEAKMIHQFDHRWASYVVTDGGKEEVKDVEFIDKQNPDFVIRPRYWVKEREVLARIARVPRAVSQAYVAGDGKGLLYAIANWVESCRGDDLLIESFHESRNALIKIAGDIFAALPLDPKDWRDLKIKADVLSISPLQEAEINFLRESHDIWLATDQIMDVRSPKWLMGFRNICRTTDERTFIASLLPRVGVGHSMPLVSSGTNARLFACLLCNFLALPFDYIVRQKVGGTNMTFGYIKQFPVLNPDKYSEKSIEFIVSRVLELTYTSRDLKFWAKDLGFSGEPFIFNPDRRDQLRAELDAYFARLYGLTRDELRYILDPAEVEGPDYPSETFRVLKNNEEKAFGEYRTQRLVLAAWDALERGELH